MGKNVWKRLMAVGCAACMSMTMPAMAVLAYETGSEDFAAEDQIVQNEITEEDNIDEAEQITETADEEELVGLSYPVGDGVFAEFDDQSGSLSFYSPGGGTLWNDWISRSGIPADLITSIKADSTSQTIYLPSDSSGIFSNLPNLTDAVFYRFNTENVTNMSSMFDGCFSLTNVDVTSFDTRQVTDMSRMFNTEAYDVDEGSYRIGSPLSVLELWSFDTDNVRNMEGMLCGLTSLTYLDISSFNTTRVQNMANMFRECSSLDELEVGNFNTSSVTDMSGMFCGCRGLNYLDLTSFSTSSVTNMQKMFCDCSSLKILDLSSFNTSRVTDESNMTDMFKDCYALVRLLTPRTSNVTTDLPVTMYDQGGTEYTSLPRRSESKILALSPELAGEYGNDVLLGLTVGDGVTALVTAEDGENVLYLDSRGGTLWDNWLYILQSVTDIVDRIRFTEGSTIMYLPEDSGRLFDGLELRNLKSVELNKVDTSLVTSMNYMFADCDGLTELDLSGFDTSNVTDMYGMFFGCKGLTDLDLGSFDTSNVGDMGWMFRDCTGLTDVNTESFVTSNVTNMGYMFSGCSSLTELDLGNFVTSGVTNMDWMFRGCTNLTDVNVSSFDTSNVWSMNNLFNNCSSLTVLDLSSFDTTGDPNASNLIYGCNSLEILVTPGNNAIEPMLPVRMYDVFGNTYEFLPILQESIVLAVTKEMAQEYDENFDQNAAVVAAASLTLEGQIGVNIKLILPDSITSDPDAYVVIGYIGEKEVSMTVPVAEATLDEGRYIFTCPVAVKEINDPVSIRVYLGDDTQASMVKGETSRIPLEDNCFTYAVSDYIESKKNEQTPIGEMCRTLSDLGAAARVYFDYEADGAVIDADISGITADLLEEYKMELSPQAAAGIKISGASLGLESETAVNVKFAKTANPFNVDNYTFTVDGDEVTPSAVSSSNCLVSIENIPAKSLDNMYTVTVEDGDGNTQALSYGALSYAYSKLSNSSSGQAVVNLSKCLYLYNQAANTYFND